jgi:hypothetical protein
VSLQPFFTSEQYAQGYSHAPMLVSLIARRNAARVTQRIATQFDKFFDAVKTFGGFTGQHRSSLRPSQGERE